MINMVRAMIRVEKLIGLTALAAILAPSVAVAAPLSSRPHGNAMGDGRELSVPGQGPLPAVVCADGDESLYGIDVSYYQGTIDWNAVAGDGVLYAFVRVSHSLQFFDPEFENNLNGSRAAGIHTGVYQYFEPDEDPVAQADLLLDNMGPLLPGDLPPVIDVESAAGQSAGAIEAAVQAWVDRVESVLGVQPIIYANGYFWQDNVGSSAFSDYPLWVPHYTNNCPNIPNQWSDWTFHQYSDSGSVAGISGNVDVNHFDGMLEDLSSFGGASECGDDICSGGENPETCLEDCPPCGVIGGDGGTIDNGDECYELYGNPMFWREETAGEGGSLVWTHATNFPEPANYGILQLYFEESGSYEVDAFIDPTFAETQQAGYQITHADGDETVVLDQSGADGWSPLGEFAFVEGVEYTIRLDDNTGDIPDSETMLEFDAVRFVRTDPPDGMGSSESGDSDPETSASDTADSSDSQGEGTGGDSTSGEGTSAGDDDETAGSGTGGNQDYLPGAGDADDSGCGCMANTGSVSAFCSLLLLVGFFRRRRTA